MLDRAEIESRREEALRKVERAKQEAKVRIQSLKSGSPTYVDERTPTGNAVEDAEQAVKAVATGFLKRAQDEAKRVRLSTDSEYWFAVCFQTREQKEAFLTAMKWILAGDKYLDGAMVARSLGVDLPSAEVPYNTSENRSTAWDEFVD